MQKLMIIILLGWLAVAGASANWFGAKQDKPRVVEKKVVGGPQQAYFEALNNHLMRLLPKTRELEANLAYIVANSSQLEPGARYAGRFLVELVERSKGNCSNELISDLLGLRATELDISGSLRIERLLAGSWQKALVLCGGYIKARYANNETTDAAFNRFLRAFNTYLGRSRRDREYRRVDEYYLNNQLRQLVRQSNRYRTDEMTIRHNGHIFDKAYEELLVEPCKRVRDYDRLLESLVAVTLADSQEYQAQGGNHFSVDVRDQLANLSWTRAVCYRIVKLEDSLKKRVFKSVTN